MICTRSPFSYLDSSTLPSTKVEPITSTVSRVIRSGFEGLGKQRTELGKQTISASEGKQRVASALLAELAMEAGLPKGVLNVHGTNDIVNAICDDDDIRAVSFVGSNTESLVVGGH